MKEKRCAITLVELAAVVGMVVLLIGMLTPCFISAREMSRRVACARNLRTIGASCKVYAGENEGLWMTPGFKETTGEGCLGYGGDLVGFPPDRHKESQKQSPSGAGGSTRVSVTRAYWMLVRSGDIMPAQFVCPSSGDLPDPTEQIDTYYDFLSYDNISYGYQVFFGPPDTRPREGADPRQVFGADKGPFYFLEWDEEIDWDIGSNAPLFCDDPEQYWEPFNSPNHLGNGQNCLYADGAVLFETRPCTGVDNDNIYTAMEGFWDDETGRTHGLAPGHTCPGVGAFDFDVYSTLPGLPTHSSTDSLVYP